eukprot:TRINITY_DN4012_c1_g1_i1.p2 TRINITY_DN4012_c1_g1~~TRINITY_DN4012_c1_g1_i1.p2  ORF type:complete len:252 (-),score=58.83 TRINITY_DN4012_c1_g1_i1:44-799(-)
MTCTLTTVFAIKEKRFQRDTSVPSQNFVMRLARGLIKMPRPVVRLAITTFFTWVGWFTFFLYITTWMAVNIYGGDPVAPDDSPQKNLFDQGVRNGAFALILNSAVSMVFSLLCPPLIRWVGLRVIWFFALVVMVACLFMPLFVKSKVAADILIAAYGVPWTIVLVAPFLVVASSVEETDVGLYLGVCNIFVVLPQLLVSAGIGTVIEYFKGDVAYALAVGGVSAIVAAISVFFIIYKPKEGHLQVVVTGGH